MVFTPPLGAWGGIPFLPERSSHPRNLSRTTGGAWGGIQVLPEWSLHPLQGLGAVFLRGLGRIQKGRRPKKPAVQERASYIQVRKG